MSRRIAVLAVVATVLLATFGAPLALASPTSPVAPAFVDGDGHVPAADNDTAANSTANATPPGQKLAGVIGVQGSETDGELERRTFETRFQKANSNASKAAVVAGQVETVRDRLTELEQQRDQLQAARENGSLSEGAYRVKMTRTVANIERTKSMLNRTADAASSVPAEDLRANGVETAELDRLRESANELAGPDVAAIARDLAGENPGKGLEKATNRRSDNETSESERNGGSNSPSDNQSENGSEGRSGSNGADSANTGSDSPSGDDNASEKRANELVAFLFALGTW
ncbi:MULTISPECIES: hypothetical protein [Haloferax]|uniref:hypothetical protein n=1 Tax=Haloferax TaxID=2251 RepID=UPI001786B871|nr:MULTISPECIES: hypothetical protein [Haloferax]